MRSAIAFALAFVAFFAGYFSNRTEETLQNVLEVDQVPVLEETDNVETTDNLRGVVQDENKAEDEPVREEPAQEEPAEAIAEENVEEKEEVETDNVIILEEPKSEIAEVTTDVERNLDIEETEQEEIKSRTLGAPGGNGDPHFKTWAGEHYEYHGQCDLVLARDPQFAEGLGLDVHIRTKLIRFWSYIKNVAIRIGSDILEIEGATDNTINNYWINYEYQGELTEIGGFPVSFETYGTHKRMFEIDLSKTYPDQKIIVQIYKEFVRVDFKNPTEEAFGKTVGMLGDFKTGHTLARDGATVLDDFYTLGGEWQVHPSEYKLFHIVEEPQFPKKCIEPEDPRGERRRRLGEMTVTEDQAEEACARLKDPLDRKDCVYDILATQDLDMIGAF